MTDTSQKRQPKGQPAGGQFAAVDRTEAETALEQKVFTWFGHWDSEGRLVLEYAVAGEVDDDRPEFDDEGHQTFAADAAAPTQGQARALILAEYDPR